MEDRRTGLVLSQRDHGNTAFLVSTHASADGLPAVNSIIPTESGTGAGNRLSGKAGEDGGTLNPKPLNPNP